MEENTSLNIKIVGDEEAENEPVLEMPAPPKELSSSKEWEKLTEILNILIGDNQRTLKTVTSILTRVEEVEAVGLRTFSRVAEIETMLNESIELWKNGQMEMHHLISNAQTKRFASEKPRKKKAEKAYTPKDKEMYERMYAAFHEETGKEGKAFTQACNMEVMMRYAKYPGDSHEKTGVTAIMEKLHYDIEATQGEGVPSILEYLQIARETLKKLNIIEPEEVFSYLEDQIEAQKPTPEEAVEEEDVIETIDYDPVHDAVEEMADALMPVEEHNPDAIIEGTVSGSHRDEENLEQISGEDEDPY